MVAIVVIGASAGGLDPVSRILADLPRPCSAAIFVVIHTGPYQNRLPFLLSRPLGPPVVFAADGAELKADQIYIPPPDHHVTLEAGRIRVDRSAKVHHTRPAADPLFISAARYHGSRVLGIVLSGGDGDGAFGLRTIKAHGGISLVQRPDEALDGGMPHSAIATDRPEQLSVDAIARRVDDFCKLGHWPT